MPPGLKRKTAVPGARGGLPPVERVSEPDKKTAKTCQNCRRLEDAILRCLKYRAHVKVYVIDRTG